MSDPRPIEDLFGELAELSTREEREAFLDRVGGEDQRLRRRLEQLLADHDQAGSLLESPESTVDWTREIAVGEFVGPYKLREQIGEGGMGAVYVAEQTQPLRRKVALKLIKPGMDSKAVIARFEAERNALALMNHPNIAKVLDAGATEQGRPFFAMELVNGIPITEYCDLHKLSIHQRLELFVPVCQAIQHAHQKGIIHRDIKPSNVLVTELDGTRAPKVIDFGVAKALNQNLTDRSIYTNFQSVIGTPLYMSPEQASLSAVDVDTRSDVYSLGVLLYELLTGTTPFEQSRLKAAAQQELLRIIREEEPPRPSNRISTLGDSSSAISESRAAQPEQLGRLVRGDLDWIVMKALSKERHRRYSTADAFAADVAKHLGNEAVDARPPTLTYQLNRFYRRNRLAAQVAAAILLLLICGVIGTASGWWASHENWKRLQKAYSDVQTGKKRIEAKNQQLSREVYRFEISESFNALRRDDFPLFKKLLFAQVPENAGEPDSRGFEWDFLWQRYRDVVARTEIEFGASIRSLAVHPQNDKICAVGFADGGVSLVHLADRTQHVVAAGNGRAPVIVRFTEDGDYLLAFGAVDRSPCVRSWRLPSLASATFEIEGIDSVRRAHISPDGKLIAICGSDRLKVLSFPDGNDVLAYDFLDQGGGNRDVSVSFSPDSKELAFRSFYSEDVLIFDLEAGRIKDQITIADRASSVSFLTENELIISTKSSSTNFKRDGAHFERTERSDGAGASRMATPDAEMLLAREHSDSPLEFWTRDGSRQLHCLLPMRGLSPEFTANGGSLVMYNENKLWVYDWDKISPKVWRHAAHWLPSVAVSGNGNRIAMPGAVGEVSVIDLAQSTEYTLTLPPGGRGHDLRLTALALSDHGEVLAASTWGGGVFVWRLDDGNFDPVVLQDYQHRVNGSAAVNALLITPDPPRLLATHRPSRRLLCWDVSTASPSPVAQAEAALAADWGAIDFAIHPHSQEFAVGFGFARVERALGVFTLDSNKLVFQKHFPDVTGSCYSVDFAPSGSEIACVFRAREGGHCISLRGLKGGRTPKPVPIAWSTCVRFTPSGDRVITASPSTEEIRIRDSQSLESMGRFALGDTVRQIEFVPKRNAFLTSSSEGITRLWSFAPQRFRPPTRSAAEALKPLVVSAGEMTLKELTDCLGE